MNKTHTAPQADFFIPLYMNGLQGRMLVVPSRNKKTSQQILIVYGQNSNLEYWQGLAYDLSTYGTVTIPDLPGFGGMESFYSVKEKPSIDSLADYLASLIKLRYKRKRIVLAGLSSGFTLITRMLQKYPELVNKVDLLFCVAGYAHHDDFKIKNFKKYVYKIGSSILGINSIAVLYKTFYVGTPLATIALLKKHGQTLESAGYSNDQIKEIMKLEKNRRMLSDPRTAAKIQGELLKLDNCQQRISLAVWHVTGVSDELLDNRNVEQHLRIIFKNYSSIKIKSAISTHNMTIDQPNSFNKVIPGKVRDLLRKNMNRSIYK